jgi:uncharacterized membrane protein
VSVLFWLMMWLAGVLPAAVLIHRIGPRFDPGGPSEDPLFCLLEGLFWPALVTLVPVFAVGWVMCRVVRWSGGKR